MNNNNAQKKDPDTEGFLMCNSIQIIMPFLSKINIRVYKKVIDSCIWFMYFWKKKIAYLHTGLLK